MRSTCRLKRNSLREHLGQTYLDPLVGGRREYLGDRYALQMIAQCSTVRTLPLLTHLNTLRALPLDGAQWLRPNVWNTRHDSTRDLLAWLLHPACATYLSRAGL
jgi:hypothetical protein